MNRRLLLIIPLLLFLGLAAIFYRGLHIDTETLPSALIGKPMPAFSLPELESRQLLTEADLKGEPALINVWATWCISCRVEHPTLNALAEAGVKIIGLNYKDHGGKAEAWLKDLGNPYTVTLFDEQGRLGFDLGVYGAPETYLFDAEGTIVYKHVGVVDDAVWQGELGQRYQALAAK